MADTMEQRLQATDSAGRRRAILITGSASGMGLETSRLFHSKGWYIVAVDNNVETTTDKNTGRPRPGLKELEAELGGPANVHIASVDVTNKEAFDALIAELETKLPAATNSEKAKLDIVFANAGIGRGGLWSEQNWQDHLDVMNVNFLGVMVAIYSSLKLMKENPGSLVFSTSSSSAMYGMPGIATYSATKHAVKGLTEALSIELGSSFKIRVADTLPGTINTPLMPTASAQNAPKTGPFRLIEPAEIAQTVWKSWVNDPDAKDALGDSTKDRIHWYVPEELQSDIDSVVNTRGGAETIRERYSEWLWKPMEARIKAAREAAAAGASAGEAK